ncbi:hypothetical protein B0H63DRAFT_540340 [Podospora didyma]|uniref:Indoleamine 2,3-dioxygenase n=1 Tax=Podospora didyma TaxID=330526 RepID=A0AAE0NRN8_9PEZI|nr:hypothetical protein B0H63DRAFT_540340 [Podospora didyma]
MSFLPEYVALSIVASAALLLMRLTTWRPSIPKHWHLEASRLPLPSMLSRLAFPNAATRGELQEIVDLAGCHETAARLAVLIHKDGAGAWPPRTNYVYSTWPEALRAYADIYLEMAPLLPAENPSLDDDANTERITGFRARHTELLDSLVNLEAVSRLLQAAEAGRWDVFPRDVYNAFYCCIAWHRHAYRWGTIPCVRVAQLEQSLPLPTQLTLPWKYLQAHFGLFSESGNITSNLMLNFSPSGTYQLKINTGLSPRLQSSEEEFARVLRDVEVLGLPVYTSIIRATIAHARGDLPACLAHVRRVSSALRVALGAYYDRMHDAKIARDAWLSHVQGFFAWGMGVEDERTRRWVTFDGLSGNQVMLFQALDAWLGLDPYLSDEVMGMNVPRLQREFCEAVRRAGFRGRLGDEGVEGEIKTEIGGIVKKLRLFRSAHRTRAKDYLMIPAPERLPMTAGKSLLKADMEASMEFLDGFMLARLRQTL